MPSILYRGLRYLICRTWSLLHPRAIAWRHIKKRHLNKPIITRLGEDLKVRIYPHDVIGEPIYVNGMFEPAECKFVMNFLKPGMLFFDIGANLGQYTLIAAQRVTKAGKVHSFEPSPRMFAELEFNVALNNFTDVCVLNRFAVADKPGRANLSRYEPGKEVYSSLGSHTRTEGAIIGYYDIETITLDEYVAKSGISHLDLIKMDIEGAELLALHGGERVLSRTEAPAIVLEMADINTVGFGYQATEIWDYLEMLGYHMYCFDKHGRISGLAQRPFDFSKAQNLVALKTSPAVVHSQQYNRVARTC